MNGKSLRLSQAGSGDSTPVEVPDQAVRGPVTLVQFEVTGTVSYQLQGRLEDSLTFVDLLDSAGTANAIVAVATCPEYRLTNSDSGTVNATLK